MTIVKISLLAVMGVMLAVYVKSCKGEYGAYLAAAVCLVIGGIAVGCLNEITGVINKLQTYLPNEGNYIALLIKAVGATYACELCAGICRDAGYGGIAGQVEMVGKLYVLLLGLPVLQALMNCIQNLVY